MEYVRENNIIMEHLRKYVEYKSEYIDEKKCIENKKFKYMCQICESYENKKNDVTIYKNDGYILPNYYVCQECDLNVHEKCLFDIMKHNRSKIKKCIFCGENKLKTVKMKYVECKYDLFKKIMEGYNFKIETIEKEC